MATEVLRRRIQRGRAGGITRIFGGLRSRSLEDQRKGDTKELGTDVAKPDVEQYLFSHICRAGKALPGTARIHTDIPARGRPEVTRQVDDRGRVPRLQVLVVLRPVCAIQQATAAT